MPAWYRTGVVNVVAGSPNVVGVGTLALTQFSVGDEQILPDNARYEVTGITDDLHWAVKQATAAGTASYAGSTLNGGNFATIRNFTSTLPAQLAGQLADLQTQYHNTLDEFSAWLSGTGDVTVHNSAGMPFTIATPAKLAASTNGYLPKSVAGGATVALTAIEAANAIIEFTGVLTASINVTVPDGTKGIKEIYNNTTGAFTLTVKTVSGSTGIAVTQGKRALLAVDGTNVITATGAIRGTLEVAGTTVASAIRIGQVTGSPELGQISFNGDFTAAGSAGVYGGGSSGNLVYNVPTGSTHDIRVNNGSVLSVSGAGASISGVISASAASAGVAVSRVRNTTAGTGASAQFSVGADNDADRLYIKSLSSTFTTAGVDFQSGTTINGEGSGGLSLCSTGGDLRIYAGGTAQVAKFNAGGFNGVIGSTTANTAAFTSSTSTAYSTVGTTIQGVGICGLPFTVDGGAGHGAVFKNSDSGSAPILYWNATTTGDGKFFNLYTEGTVTLRGGANYNRAGGVTNFATTSDYRVKELFGEFCDLAGVMIDDTPVYNGRMIAEGAWMTRPMFIAHEVQKWAPWTVTGVKDGPEMQTLSEAGLVPILWAEVRNLRRRVTVLEQ